MNRLRARSPMRCGRACVAHRRRSHSSRLGTGARCGQCPGGDCDRSGRHHGLQRSRSKRGVPGRKRCARYVQSRARHQAATPQRVGRFRTGGDRLAQLPGGASRISSHGYGPSLQTALVAPALCKLDGSTQDGSHRVVGESTFLMDRQLTKAWDAFTGREPRSASSPIICHTTRPVSVPVSIASASD